MFASSAVVRLTRMKALQPAILKERVGSRKSILKQRFEQKPLKYDGVSSIRENSSCNSLTLRLRGDLTQKSFADGKRNCRQSLHQRNWVLGGAYFIGPDILQACCIEGGTVKKKKKK